MIDFFSRLDMFAEFRGLNDNKITVEAGISNGLMGKGRKRGSLSQDTISKILYRYPELDANWLFTGQGEMLKNETYTSPKNAIKPDVETSDLQNKYNNNKQTNNPTSKGIPLIPVEAMAGYGSGDVQVMDYEIQEDYIVTPEFENKGIKYLIRVSGSSMTPKYNNGDLLACRPINDISFMQWGKVYVLDTEQGPLVKRLYPCDPEDKECLECRSDNFEKYPPFKIQKISIRRIAIVVGVLRLE